MQTAVIGDEHSDVPVVLPTAAIELDAFRLIHGGDTFWCGVLLGGCGARLSDKLYVDRQCHFQHYPQGHAEAPEALCRRRGVGEASADHLYVKHALHASLDGHGRAARFSYPDPVGSVLDVDLDDGRRLRVHLDGRVRPSWGDGVPILAADAPLEPGTFSRCRYVYRVRLQADGAERRVWIGTEGLAHPTEWAPLAECGWGADGLVTDAATRILRGGPVGTGRRPVPEPVPEPVTRLIRGLESAQRAGTVEHVRRLCAGADRFLAELEPSARAAAEEALGEARDWLHVHASYQAGVFADLAGAVREQRAWDVRAQLAQALTLTRRGASAAEQAVLDEARAFLRAKDHPASTAPVHRPPALRANPYAVAAQPRRRTPRRSVASLLQHERVRERDERLAAVKRVRKAVKHLQRPGLSRGERRGKIAELKRAMEQAGDALPIAELRRTRALVREQPGKERPAQGQARARESRPREPRPTQRQPEALSQTVLASAAAAVRGALKRTARGQGTVTWAHLRKQLGSALPQMSELDRQRVILLVDAAAKPDEPLLSCVLAAREPQLAEAYRQSANAQGLHLPAEDRELLRDIIDADLRRTHDYWRTR
ncbi:hypothetical protein ACIRL3_45895 [Streptomyces sp. NPDC102384]|uniref:hypothetical protein n=1 Tax=Streptomyces sp. NPDC102384 TaxID=3366166 RepID=UPI0037FC1911